MVPIDCQLYHSMRGFTSCRLFLFDVVFLCCKRRVRRCLLFAVSSIPLSMILVISFLYKIVIYNRPPGTACSPVTRLSPRSVGDFSGQQVLMMPIHQRPFVQESIQMHESVDLSLKLQGIPSANQLQVSDPGCLSGLRLYPCYRN